MDWKSFVCFALGVVCGAFGAMYRLELQEYGRKAVEFIREFWTNLRQPDVSGLEVRTVVVDKTDCNSKSWQFLGINLLLPGCEERRKISYTYLQYPVNVASDQVLEEVAGRGLTLAQDSSAAIALLADFGEKCAAVIVDKDDERPGSRSVVWRDASSSVHDYQRGGFRAGVKFLVIIGEEIAH